MTVMNFEALFAVSNGDSDEYNGQLSDVVRGAKF